MEAASDVSALPIVEMSCPVHIKEKLRFLKMAKGEAEADVVIREKLL